ncbi:hypothetical protein [Actinopolyspora mortivallis]|uniref:hypothetical protein n=1 Tax=Actinopolyspora mortivallis TaxID=33906 RepID=UPI0003637FD3|nr:hypothetical protein [Actinopolyspora mortivallis]
MILLAFLLLPLLVFGLLAATVKLIISIDRRSSVGVWLYTATFFLFLAALDYAWGYLHKFTVPDVAETCLSSPREGPRGGGFERIDYGIFPPSAECVWANGNTSDLVPGYVAPLLYVFLGGALLCLVTAAWFRLRDTPTPMRETRNHEDG